MHFSFNLFDWDDSCPNHFGVSLFPSSWLINIAFALILIGVVYFCLAEASNQIANQRFETPQEHMMRSQLAARQMAKANATHSAHHVAHNNGLAHHVKHAGSKPQSAAHVNSASHSAIAHTGAVAQK